MLIKSTGIDLCLFIAFGHPNYSHIIGDLHKADGVLICVWSQKRIDENAGVEKVLRLNLPQVLDKLVKSRDALLAYSAATNSWIFPLDFDAEQTEMKKLVGAWRAAVVSFRRHVTGLQQMAGKLSAAKEKAQRDWRKVRDSIRDWLQKRQVPPCLAMPFANWLTELGRSSSNVGINMNYVRVPELDAENITLNTFATPFVITEPKKVAPEQRSKWQSMWAEYHDDNMERMEQKMGEGRD